MLDSFAAGTALLHSTNSDTLHRIAFASRRRTAMISSS
jgi:hypothetical protein